MSERDDFLAWVNTSLAEAERAMFDGDDGPRREIWSRAEPVSVLGAWRNATSPNPSPRRMASRLKCGCAALGDALSDEDNPPVGASEALGAVGVPPLHATVNAHKQESVSRAVPRLA